MKNIFITHYRHFWKFVPSGLAYLFLSLLIIPKGLASVGMTCVTRNIVWGRHSYGLSDFMEAIRKNWSKAIVASVVNSIVYIILVFDFMFFGKMDGGLVFVGHGVIACAFMVFTIMNYYIWTLMITFDYSLKQVYVNSFKFVFVNFARNFICVVCNVVVYVLYFVPIYVFSDYALKVILIEMIVCLLTYPAFKHLLIQYSIFPALKKYIIEPYYDEHSGEDKEKRQFLGIYTK